MSKLNSEMFSRRKALSLLGLATLGLTAPATVLTVSDAEAQQAAPGAAPSTAPETGTERRQGRRTNRTRRRTGRREARRRGREERGELRSGGGAEKGSKQ